MEYHLTSFESSLKLPNSLFTTNRQKLVKAFKQGAPEHARALIIFKGKEEIMIDSTDFGYEAKQESFFYYLTRVKEMGCSAIIDIENEKLHLFIPRLDSINYIWMKITTVEEMKEVYLDFDIHFLDELEQWVKDLSPF